ncbi:amino acid ABC transporter substrate-binding protein [bacterium]|nr:MAG: amino acid ABC transporter substrate-binding protein [bacterium]
MKASVNMFFACFVFICMSLVAWSTCRFTTKKQTTNTLVVGTVGGYAPFVSMNEKGDYEGFDIDVAQALAAKLGKTLVLQDLGSMAPLLMTLEQGSVDVVIWDMTITSERLQKFAMVSYQNTEIKTTNPLIFWQKVPAGITTLADLKGMTVCVEPTSAQSSIINKYRDIFILPTEKIDDALLNIQYGKADAAFVDQAIAQKFKAKYPEIQIVDMPLDEEDFLRGSGIMIKKNNTELIRNVEAAVEQLKKSGAIATFETKWGLA